MDDENKRRKIAADVERRLQLDGGFHVRVIDPKGKSTEEILAELADFAASCQEEDG